jgi:D-amino-acid dehydrogenase
MTSLAPPADVAVVGGGVIGAFCALELAQRGASVIVLDRQDHWGAECSSANAGMFVPSHARPIAAPENLRMAARWMFRRGAPFGLRPSRGLATWLPHYLLAARASVADEGERVQRALTEESLRLTLDLQAAGLDLGVEQAGTLVVHSEADGSGRAAVEVEAAPAGAAELLDASALAALEPRLPPASAAVLYRNEAHCDPVRFMKLLGTAAEAAGAEFRPRTAVSGLKRRAGGVEIETSVGPVFAGEVVIAAGAWSTQLNLDSGLRMPMLPGRGLAIDFPTVDPMPRRPLYLHDERIVVSPMGDRVRLSSGLVLDKPRMRVDQSRVRAIEKVATRLGISGRPRRTWVGLRPCPPDGLPLLGRDPRSDGRIVIATGHGMLGMTLGALTGQIVADLMLEGRPHPALRHLEPDRFSLVRTRRPGDATADG